MLKRARAKLAEVGSNNIEVRAAPAEGLPVPDASFDAVISTLVLCTVRDVPAVLAEVRRVLRPEGKLFFIEHVRGDGALGRAQDLIRPVWSYFGAGCQINRRTEEALERAGLHVTVTTRTKLAPPLPAIIGRATLT
jgi:ubiquinone/menaquinone biosynthesis C-methylase UbiE